ncbi:MAG: hypothetical protein IT328_13105 [Caldilineaceae bacterium]|nr:hypothetical protein [Caldilineaceae bacterium]
MGNPQLGSGVDPTVSAEAQRIATQLQEPLLWLVESIINVLGQERAENLLQQTLEIEASGGILTTTGDRRRTPGGVYMKLLKEQSTPEEVERIFAGGPQKPKPAHDGGPHPADPPPLGPLPWDEARVEISRLVKLPLEKASVKITLVGRPSQVSKTKSCVVVAMKGSRPPSLPKGLPPAPDGSDFSYAVFISLRHWAKVAPVMAQDKDERLLVEGYPIFDPKRGITVILAQNVRTVNMSRRESRPSSR